EVLGQQRPQQRRHRDLFRPVRVVGVAARFRVVATERFAKALGHRDTFGSRRTTMLTWIRYSRPDHKYIARPQIKKPHPMASTTRLQVASHCPNRISGSPDISANVAALPM